MKTQFRILSTVITSSLFCNMASAANYSIEARSDAMGGVGTVSASYLTAPFFNPALSAIYRRNDDAGIIAPSFGFSFDDQYDLIDEIDRISKLTDASEIESALDALAVANQKLNFDLGGVISVGIPNKFLSATVYGKLYTESFVQPKIDTSGTDPREKSYVQGVSIGVAEAGISLAKYTNYMGQHLSVGITPKLQRIYTYSYATSFGNFDTADLRENETAETMFNLDAGALWFFGPYRLGIAAKNLIGRDVETKSFQYNGKTIESHQYSMRPVYTIGAGIAADYFTMSVDYDLNEEKRFSSFDDNTQMIRAGVEFDILRQMALRAGYMKNLARSNDEGTITAGVGLSPLNLIELDIAARYTNENAMGASINFLATY
ncbi:conjugal transfer protein TraF [Vibrio sp. J1-1]|uniref:conjugal transfer protein TraF n=1 Tax=Vibrio sp. J1-1 TaxID=2912251 RepID=UPI001F3047F5|nr:conjugal transfer protein TraF [Vibrio sp. J1-1]MBR9874185.1 conjugal transfer protein TraF [Vibrionaceae bacterium]MCF7483343.1 conjugal transfer protein TraF [Vibrio sp. J1-1]